MTDYIRTPEENFCDLIDFNFSPNYHEWQDMRVHYLDEGELLHAIADRRVLASEDVPIRDGRVEIAE